MPSIPQYLPILEGWQHTIEEYEPPKAPKRIAPGEDLVILAPRVSMGWFVGGGLHVDNQDVRLMVEADSWIVDCTPRGLYNSGLTAPVAQGVWLSRYDTTEDVYYITITMTCPMPYKIMHRVYLRNPTLRPDGTANTTCLLIAYTFSRIEIFDIQMLKQSLRELTEALPVPQR